MGRFTKIISAPTDRMPHTYRATTKTTEAELDEVQAWAIDQFGRPDETRWIWAHFIVLFRDPQDAFAFKMRWC